MATGADTATASGLFGAFCFLEIDRDRDVVLKKFALIQRQNKMPYGFIDRWTVGSLLRD